jgi:4-hydroxy-4-methyl-2-oxoglutarate aldolase
MPQEVTMPKTYSHEEILTLCERLEKVYTPAVADTLDGMGFMNQAMHAGFAPIIPGSVVAGPAFTIEEAKTRKSKKLDDYDPEWVAQALTLLFGSMKKGEVVAVNTNGFSGAGAWGELMSTTCKYFGGVKGAVVDGPIRDISRILEIEFPVWAKGSIPTDSIGRVDLVGVGGPVWCGGIKVIPGDIIFADRDGVVVIPVADVDLKEVVERSEEVVAAERRSRQEIRQGSSLLDVYKKYGKL